ncbi:hypothetical protein BDN70DRAFT_992737 [Pholiota conissans]|uniref:F-box domain-containing protein n=1 Tax=Pholiota conissans TaxID=109636 RepID=A0A9P5Z2U9_9AGAR|nr:hypothetical protein BDN70DRAFT_992737 [Pholiota conissans]
MPTPTGSALVPNSMPHFYKAPIDNLPYDVIREIFIHCVSTDPFREPRATLEPMLLTQICSSWRSIALESPTLWTHLYFCLTIAKIQMDGAEIIPKRQIDLLRWWKGNHNSLMPHLSLETQFRQYEETQEYLQVEESLDFILAYIASAQYISMERFYWIQIEKRMDCGDKITFPHLHTVVDNPGINYRWNPSLALVDRITKQCHSSLRYLSLSIHYFPAIPSQWAFLTHISLQEMQLSPTRWFTLICSFPKLHWGNFHIEAPFGMVDNIDTSRCTLPELADIFITFDDRDNDSFRISFIFANLYLPSLRTLSIYALTKSWKDIRSVAELRTILKSTPAITTLILGPGFLSLHQPHRIEMIHSMNDVEPIWDIATQLIHLQLEINIFSYGMRYTPKETLDIFMKKAFLSNTGWLPLKNPMCPIQKISIVGGGLLNKPLDYALASLSELSGEIPTIRFEFTSNSTRRNADEAWKYWH